MRKPTLKGLKRGSAKWRLKISRALLKKYDLTGKTFGRLFVIKLYSQGKNGQSIYLCKCICGNYSKVVGSNLSYTVSCGCYRDEINKIHSLKHGKCYTATYHVWQSMKWRCLNNKNRAWENYGGRGIKICDRWLKFENFLADMGEKPLGLSLDRIDNNGDYEPQNCRWATIKEQSRNKRSCRRISFGGKTMILVEWAENLGIKPETLTERLNHLNWGIKKSLTTPIMK